MGIDYKAIGERIREARNAKRWTQAQLAEMSGIETSNISHIERAATKLSFPTLVSIANALDVSLDALVYDSLTQSAHISCDRINDLLADCTYDELRAITEMIIATKKILRDRR